MLRSSEGAGAPQGGPALRGGEAPFPPLGGGAKHRGGESPAGRHYLILGHYSVIGLP